jgi:hypothetical protein
MSRLLLCSLLFLVACNNGLPPADPEKAWIDLHSIPANQFSAQELNGRQWPHGRFFEVAPGAHRLQARLRFETGGGGRDLGAGMQTRTCILHLDYPAFEAGGRYLLKAGATSRRAWMRLYDGQGNLLARGKQLRCGAF